MPISGTVKSLGHSVCFRSGLSTAVARLQGCVRIIMYHGILACDQERFAAQLEYFRRRFRVVSLATIVQQLGAGDRPGNNHLVLTFDDGLRNNLTVAYPVLKKLGLPATFFVCPGLVDAGKWLWTHEARCRLGSLNATEIPSLAGNLGCTHVTIEGVVEHMKTLPLQERKKVEEKIRSATSSFQPTAADHEAHDVMNWNELRSLDPKLITIGSHTNTHPMLTSLDTEQIDFEMVESRRALERELGRPVNYFCYPNGSHHAPSAAAAQRTYSASVTTRSGMVKRTNSGELHLLPRIAATKDSALMAWRMHRPGA